MEQSIRIRFAWLAQEAEGGRGIMQTGMRAWRIGSIVVHPSLVGIPCKRWANAIFSIDETVGDLSVSGTITADGSYGVLNSTDIITFSGSILSTTDQSLLLAEI
jgi:hypothetical protein